MTCNVSSGMLNHIACVWYGMVWYGIVIMVYHDDDTIPRELILIKVFGIRHNIPRTYSLGDVIRHSLLHGVSCALSI